MAGGDIPGAGSAQFSGSPPQIHSGPPMPPPPAGLQFGQLRSKGGQFASGGMYVVWQGLEDVIALPERVGGDLSHAADAALRALQDDMVAFAQENAPWTDFTGDARAELHSPAILEEADGTKTIILAHGVDYGVYLETMDGGVWGIIPRTIQEFAGQLSQRIGAEVGK
jgi:hypothetical protein